LKALKAEAFFIKHGAEIWKWKRLNFCGSGSTLKKEAGSRSNQLYMELEAEAKIFYCFHILDQNELVCPS